MTDTAPAPSPSPIEIDLPAGFSWGVAASAHQIEGAVDEGGRAPSIWDTFSATPGKVAGGQTAAVACDHYHRVAEDVALMADLGVDTYRFSLAWPRLIPSGDGEVNPDGVEFYRRLCELLADAGIRPLVALFHWDLPQVLQDRGGWASPESVEWFAHYAGTAKRALGDLASDWLTINEPYCAAFLGHGSGHHAPGIADPGTAFLAAHHMLLAHHRAVAVLRETVARPEDTVTIALNLIPAQGQDPDGADDAVAEAVDLIHSQMWLDGVLEGRYPDAVLALHDRYGVADRVDVDELARVHQPIDHLAVNYYNITHVRHVEGAPAPGAYPGADGAVEVTPPAELTEMGWGVEPEGLARVLRRVGQAYPDLPLVVSENGAAFADEVAADGVVHDPRRIDYLRRHLEVIAEAVADGIDVRGYHVWSLLDNFEWALGFDKRFGLIRVDFDTLERTPKDSARWYADVIAAHRARHAG
ncbi:GH1 family beta-glucosidase [Euzebya sp.]|uniref:GH1 family beta-glucosidase n=1 Tax=Euzebya sp. TaxID=1971409 RepID=UPI003519B062